MKQMLSLLKEIRDMFLQIIVLYRALDSLVIFFVCYIVLEIIGLQPLWAFVPAIIFFAACMTRDCNKINLRDVETKYPMLDERLRTAADNIDKNNFMVHKLQEEVFNKVRLVKMSSFINFKKLSGKLIAVIALSFLVVFIASFNVQLYSFRDHIRGLTPPIMDGIRGMSQITSGVRPARINGLDNIYGDPSIAILGNERINVELSTLKGEIDLSSLREAKESQFRNEFPPNNYISSDSSFDEDIPKKYREVVKTYFNDINKGG